MKLINLLVFGLSVFVLSSCKDDPEGSLTLHFKGLYNNQTLQTFDSQPFVTPQQLQFTHLSMLISDLRLIDQSSEEPLDDIELVDLSFEDLASAGDGYTLSINHIPARNYNGIRFGIGVPQDVNLKTPADFPSSNPLSKTGYYWVAWNSFIFLKIEGRLDTIGNGVFDTGFAMHTGSDELFRSVEGLLPLNIEEGKVTKLEILIDYQKLLEGVDIKGKPQNHNPQDTVEILKIVSNLPASLSLIQ